LSADVQADGLVKVYSGILPICKDDVGVATVLSHQVAHVIAEHDGEAMNKWLLYGVTSIPLWPIFGMAALGLVITELWLTCSPYLLVWGGCLAWSSRPKESEADYIRLTIMSNAGYDIREAPQFWRRMEKYQREASAKMSPKDRDRAKPPEFLSSHPHVSIAIFSGISAAFV
jgi:predicted Zn-dependent protease